MRYRYVIWWWWPFLVCVLLCSLLAYSIPRSLPHRQEWELYRQANSPDAHHCQPGTTPYYVYADDGTPFFVECLR